MGRRGPLPTPTAILNLRGSWRGKEREQEPDVRPGRPAPPDWLTVDEKRLFRKITWQLHRARVITKLDDFNIAAYVRYRAEFISACQMVQRMGPVMPVKNKHGEMTDAKVSPYFKARNALSFWVNKYAEILGLGPGYRARIQTLDSAAEAEDPLVEFLTKVG